MLKFSRAQRPDALPVLRLYQLCSRQEQCTWNACYPGIEDVKKDLSDGGLYVLRSQGRIVACGSLILPEEGLETGDAFTPAQKPCALARLGVLPDMQRQGFGKAMLCGILNAARAQGYDAARLLVGSGNIPALRLYENAGFIAVGETDAYGMHWLQMERLLQS
jgi:ribosomal protein S18 acetylase RimI-like enzyme